MLEVADGQFDGGVLAVEGVEGDRLAGQVGRERHGWTAPEPSYSHALKEISKL